MTKYVMITGGAGLIGSNICKLLVKEGKYTPLVVDIFVNYINPTKNKKDDSWYHRFEGIADKVVMRRANCSDYSVVYDLLKKYKPEYIIHLAALPLAKMSDTSPHDFKEGPISATSVLLHAVHKLKEEGSDFLKKFVYTSSSMVYGHFEQDPAPEDHPTRPMSLYGTYKLAGENISQGLCKTYGLNYAIIRPSAVYGPTDLNRRVSQIFVENAIHGKTLKIIGGDKEILDFSYVTDVAEGFLLTTLSDVNNEIFNITGGDPRSLLDFANIVKEYFPEVNLEIMGRDESRPIRGGLDISKARKLLNYNPKVKLEEGIKVYLDFLLEKNGNSSV